MLEDLPKDYRNLSKEEKLEWFENYDGIEVGDKLKIHSQEGTEIAVIEDYDYKLSFQSIALKLYYPDDEDRNDVDVEVVLKYIETGLIKLKKDDSLTSDKVEFLGS